jgi:Cys-rich protein (TIGR01571 family)
LIALHMEWTIQCFATVSSFHKVRANLFLKVVCILYAKCTHPHSHHDPIVALTQIMTRMKLSNYGERRTSPNSRMRIKTVVLLSSCYFFLNLLLICTMIWTPNIAAKIFSGVVFALGNGPAIFAFCHVVVQTRQSIRSAYSIPESRCEGCEDLLVSVWCTPCTIAQMMHQTADYDTYRAVWFSESGLPHHVMTEAQSPTQRNTNASLI